jgi:hypothetical protein
VYQTLKLGRLSIAVAYATLMAAAPAFSQGVAAPRSSGGLFGATRSDVGGRDKLTFLFDMSETRDSALPAELRSRISRDDLQSGGFSTMLIASTDYARNRSRVQLAGTALTAFKYYQRLDRVAAVSHSAGLGATVHLPKQGSFEIDQTAAYSPSYWYQLFPTGVLPEPGESIPADPDYRIDQTDSYSYGTRMALAFGSARRTRVTTTAEYSHTDFQRQTAARPDLTILSAGAKVSRGVSRHSGFSVEYEYRSGQFGFVEPTIEHRITMGVEYSRALTVSRRAIFRVNVSPSMLEVPEEALATVAISPVPIALEESVTSTGDGAVQNAMDGRLYRLQGDAGVEYPFRPNWRATVTYRRGVEYLAVLREPVFSNGARAELTGVIRRRLDLSAVAGYATGASAINRGGSNLGTYTGEVRVRYALKRPFALYSQYLYYYYDLRGQARLAPDLPSVFAQHGIRVGFMLFGQALGK